MQKTADRRNPVDRYLGSLRVSTALAVILCAGTAGQPAFGQSVTATGDVNPGGTADHSPAWNISGSLIVGDVGTGTLTVEGGGEVSNGSGYIGNGANGTVTISGAGSKWTNSYGLFVGYNGTGTLTINDGGKVSNDFGYIGTNADLNGTVTVSGAGSKWTNVNDLHVGFLGTGTLIIEKNGLVEANWASVGLGAGSSTGTINLIGNAFDGRGILETGYVEKGLGSATLNLNGGILRATRDESNFLRGFGALTVGSGGAWLDTNGHDITVGPSTTFAGSSSFNKIGAGTLTLTGNSSAFAGNTTVDGGTLAIAGGGKFGGNSGYIGTGSNGAVTVSGVGSTWTNANDLYVGVLGTGTLTVSDGGMVSNTIGYIGYNTSASGSSVTVSGVDAAGNASTWTNTNDLIVGYFGTGTLSVENGGKVSNTGGYIGFNTTASGSSVIVSGTDADGNASTWTNDGELYVGYNGTSTLTISGGGAVSSTKGYIGYDTGSSGSSVTVSGTDADGNASIWASNDILYVGLSGRGRLTIENGGKVSSVAGVLGNYSDAEGDVTVSGRDAFGNASTWTISGSLEVGRSGTGTLTVSDGGTVEASTLYVANSGTLNIGAAAGDAAVAAGTLDTGSVQFHNGTGTLNFNHLGNTTFDAALISASAGTHAVNHLAGTTTLTGDSSAFSGTTIVSGGTLTVANALGGSASVTGGSFVVNGTFGGDVAARTAGVLTGSGHIVGNADLTNGGVFAGASGQTLRVDGNVVMDATSVLNASLGAASSTALVSVGGDLALNGSLNVTDAGGFGAGVYRLIDYDGSLGGSGLTIGATPSGVDTADLSVQTSVANQVNLISVSGAQLGFWDGGNAGLHDNGAVDGGSGVWRADGRNWTQADGAFNGPFQPIPTYAVFQGTGGAVTVDGSAGAIGVTGMQFAADGYRVEGDSIALQGAGGTTTIRVGDGTQAGAGMTATIASALTGSSTLVKSDYGMLILTGANSYTGGTQIVAGTLVGNVGSIRGDIANAGTVEFAQTANASFAGDITGLGGTNGAMVKSGAGNLTLTGTSSLDWTIETGSLSTDASRFTGNAAIQANANLTFDQGGNASYAGILSGAGDFTKSGTGLLTLIGDSSAFAGMTTISAGILAVNGRLGGTISVANGGTLGGAGSIGNLLVNGTVAPGNSIGTLNVGSVTFNTGSIYQVEVNAAGEADKIVASGTATINGGGVQVLAGSGNYAPQTKYTILTAAGGRTGTFTEGVTSNVAFLDPSLSYDANNVYLTMSRNDISFAGIGMTPNQIAAASGIESLTFGNPVYDAVLNLSAPQARDAFDALSGEIHASAKTAMVEDSRFVRNAINDRIRAAFDVVGALGGPVATYVDGQPRAVAANTDGLAVWGQGFGSWGHWNSDGNVAKLDRSIGGFFIGADVPVFDTWRLGVVGGYSRTDFKTSARLSSTISDNYHVGLYGGTTWGDLAFRTGAAYTWHDISTSRAVSFPGFGDSLKGDYNAGTAQVFGELGYGINMGAVRFEPFANLAYVNLHTDSFTEKGGAAALTSGSATTDATFTTLGLRASTTFDLNGMVVTAKGTLGWRHAFGDTAPEATMRFAAGGDPFTIAGVPIARDAAIAEAGLNFNLSPNAVLGVSYGGQFGSGVTDQTFRASFNVKF